MRLSSRGLHALARITSAFTIPQPNETLPASAPAQMAGPTAGAAPRQPPTTVLRRSLLVSIAEGAMAEVFGSLTTGAVTTAWALHLGAGPAIFGLLGALPLGAQVVNLPLTWFTEHIGRKRVTVWAVGAARLVYLPLPLLPLLSLTADAKLGVFLLVVGSSTVLGVVGNNAWTAWMGDLVPRSIRGRFFGRRTIYLSLAGTVSSIGAAMLLDGRRDAMDVALATLTTCACLVGAVTIALLHQQAEPLRERHGTIKARGLPLREIATDPLVRPFLRYQISWHAAVAISASFFSFHMLTNLQTSFLVVAAHGVVVAAVRIAAARLWGQTVDRVGARPVIIVCSFGLSLAPMVWFLATPDRLWPIGLEAMMSGLFWAGHGIAATDLSIDLAPRRRRSVYLAVIATTGGLGFACASLLAGRLAGALPTRFDLGGHWLTGIHVLFLLSAIGRVAAAVLALQIRDPGARGGVGDVLRALASDLWPRVPERQPFLRAWLAAPRATAGSGNPSRRPLAPPA